MDVFVVERCDDSVRTGIVGLGLLYERTLERGNCLVRNGLSIIGFAVVLEDLFPELAEYVRDIGHAAEESHAQARNRQFLVPGHCPVAVLEVIVLRSGEALNAGITAVVIGYQETLAGYHLGGASATEMHYRILERGIVDAVDLFSREAAAKVRHSLRVHLLQQREHPHALVCPQDGGCRQEQGGE